MSDPLIPNYKKDVGRLATDRYDFEEHIEGIRFRHKAGSIDLFPTLIIGVNQVTDVQSALEALRDAAQPPVISDATSVTKGILKLNGDISGTADSVIVSRIQGKLISTLSPGDGDVLTWDGIANIWKPLPATNAFSAAGDLDGNNVLQNVIGLTGTEYNPLVGFVIKSSNTVMEYDNGLRPLITQTTSSTAHAANITIKAQSTTSVGKNGGDVVISGGAAGSGGRRGGVKLQLTTSIPSGWPRTAISGDVTTNMVHLSEPAVGRRVLALCHSSDLSTIDMPSNTGDMVMYVRNAASIPTTGNPSNGVILYATGGELWLKQQDGNNFGIGSIPNPSIWGPSGEQTYTNRSYVTSTTSASLAFSFTLPDTTATRVDVIFIGKKVGTADSAQFNLSMGYVRDGGSPVAVGSITNADSRATAGAITWNFPTISVSGNTLQVFTGYSGSATIKWLVITQLTMSQG